MDKDKYEKEKKIIEERYKTIIEWYEKDKEYHLESLEKEYKNENKRY